MSFPAEGDAVQVSIVNGSFSSMGDRCDVVQEVGPYGIRIAIYTRYHVPEYDRERYYHGQEYSVNMHIRFYPWINVLSVSSVDMPAWLAEYREKLGHKPT